MERGSEACPGVKAPPVDPQSPGEPFRPPLIMTRPARFSFGRKVADDKTGTGWSRLDRWGRAGPLAAVGREVAQPSAHLPAPPFHAAT
jgi:hypothetical protein